MGGAPPRGADSHRRTLNVCGIVGVIGGGDAATILAEGLKRLEYRGYDSAGMATVADGRIERRRAEGKLDNLAALLRERPLAGTLGIGHTRWATHGAATERNAHPHATARVAVVHNGIVENYRELRRELADTGYLFVTETDTEAVVQLLTRCLDEGMAPEEATAHALSRLQGAFALGIVFAGRDDLLIAARRGSPLVLGWGEESPAPAEPAPAPSRGRGMFLGSDALALAPFTDRVTYLRDGEWAVLRRDGATVRDGAGVQVTPEVRRVGLAGGTVGKGGFRHFMLKEIYEQPTVVGETLNAYFNPAARAICLPAYPFDPGSPAFAGAGSAMAGLAEIDRVTLVACGTSYFAACVARYWLESVARVAVNVEIASEYRYRDAAPAPGGFAVFVSQSGETADTLAALRRARADLQRVAAIVNVPESAMAREAGVVFPTHAGPEIGVASTKAFTCQLMVLACFAIALGVARGALDRDAEARLCRALAEAPARTAEALGRDDSLRALAHWMAEARDVLYIGRGPSSVIALEGALKLKEVSYIHAEGFPAGELKHGPIALVDETVPIVVVAPRDTVFAKTVSNMEEAVARGGRAVLLSDAEGIAATGRIAAHSVELPAVDPFVAPFLYALPVQLLAYHVAVRKGTDVDQPRNLAKSVTVE